jgi:hypothetical protein
VTLVNIYAAWLVLNEWKTEKRQECTNLGKVKRLELWWQLYVTSLPERDILNIRSLDFCQSVPSTTTRSANNCIYSILYLSYHIAICRFRGRFGTDLNVLWVAYATHSTLKSVPTLPQHRQIKITVWQLLDAVDIFVCAPDYGWWYHPKDQSSFQLKQTV